MKFAGNLLIASFFSATLISNSQAAIATYQFSGVVSYMTDYNENVDFFGANYVYPSGISTGTPFSVTLNLSGDLGALNGTIDFDLGGIYQGQHNIGGAASLCDGHSCTGYSMDINNNYHGNGDYDDPLFPYIGNVQVANQNSIVTTNLPLSDLNNNVLFTFVSLNFAQNTNKPAITTLLSDLPISSISFGLGSNYYDMRDVSCPACVEGYTTVTIGQGWFLSGTSNAVVTVPEPAAFWLFGFGLIVVLFTATRRKDELLS